MRAYIIRRLLLLIPTLLMVTIIVFFLVRLIPGDVIEQMIVEMQYKYVERDIAEMKAALGLDMPIHVQYGRWIGNIVLHGDFGKSLWSGRPVLQEMLVRIPVTVELGILAVVISLIIALPVGVYSAVRQDTGGDYLARSFAIICIAVPSFWLGTLVMVLPSVWWDWSPRVDYIPFVDNPTENLGMFIIPAIVLGMWLSGTTTRMTRTMMLEVLRQDYIRTAWSKGLTERVIVMRHALKNALIPVVTLVGLSLPFFVGTAVVVEQIFVLPGLGRLLLEALKRRDYTIVSGVNLVVGVAVMGLNLAVDLTYAFLDPRVHYK